MLVAMLACFDVSTAFAATSGNCGANFGGTNAKWSLNTSTGVLTISGKGATKDCGNVGSNQAPWKDSRDKIKSIVVEEGITALGRYMFYKCEVAESVSLPSTLTAIGDTKYLEYGTFVDCKALTNVTLPSKLQTIGHAAFKGCSSLKSIKIPDSVTTIGTSAFEDCTALSTVTFGTGVKVTGNMAFRNSGVSKVSFSSTITEISPWSFYGCKFVNLEIPETEVEPFGEISLSFTVENTSERAGDEVVQIYLSDCFASRTRPVKELAAFRRISLKAHEKKTIRCQIAASQLAFLDKNMKWKIEKGDVDILIGASSEDIRLRSNIHICEDAWIEGRNRAFYGKAEVL